MNLNQDFTTNNNTNKFENIFNLQTNNNPNNNKESQIPNLLAQKPEFNIQKVYQNTTQLKQELKTNDPFNFVDDLLKKK